MSIDDYTRRKGHRYNTLIVDLDTGKPIVTFPGRRAKDVVAWLRSRRQEELHIGSLSISPGKPEVSTPQDGENIAESLADWS
jgi:transposase